MPASDARVRHARPRRPRLLREARAAAALDHPNAVTIFDVGEYEGTPFIVMELVVGRTLRGAVGDASVPAATRVAELADVARALAVAHKRGLVHRDIKPENVMVRAPSASLSTPGWRFPSSKRMLPRELDPARLRPGF